MPRARPRDLRELGWWLIEQVLEARIDQKDAAVVSTLIRTLATLGPSPLDDERALREVMLRGRLMHGLPPASEDEWRQAEEAFEPAAIAEFLRWRPLLEGDAEDRFEPLLFGEMGGEELDTPFVADGEDGG